MFPGGQKGAPGFLPLLGAGEKKAPSGKLPGGSLVTPMWSKKILPKKKVVPGGKMCPYIGFLPLLGVGDLRSDHRELRNS